MKHIVVTFGLTVLSAVSLATPKHAALCERQLLLAHEEVNSPDLITIQDSRIEDFQSLNPVLLTLINKHIRSLKYTDKDLSLEEIKALFMDGEFDDDDLNVSSYQSKSTGFIYYEVASYPGDSRYSIFTDLNGNTVAITGDSDIYLKDNSGDILCYDRLGH